MAEHGRTLEFGYFPVPSADARDDLLRQGQLAEGLGYDLIGVQDHPYQRRFFETPERGVAYEGAHYRLGGVEGRPAAHP